MNGRGFTLLEVLVALAILGVAVVASIQGFAQGLRLLKLAGDHQDAMLVADQKVREVVALEESSEEGTETRFQWRRTVERVQTSEPGDLTQPSPWTVYRIDVHVRWDERREIHLATLRTAANVSASQAGSPPSDQAETPEASQPETPDARQPGKPPPGRPRPPRASQPSR